MMRDYLLLFLFFCLSAFERLFKTVIGLLSKWAPNRLFVCEMRPIRFIAKLVYLLLSLVARVFNLCSSFVSDI